MGQRDKQAPQSAEETVRDIRRATRRHYAERRRTGPKRVGRYRSLKQLADRKVRIHTASGANPLTAVPVCPILHI